MGMVTNEKTNMKNGNYIKLWDGFNSKGVEVTGPVVIGEKVLARTRTGKTKVETITGINWKYGMGNRVVNRCCIA